MAPPCLSNLTSPLQVPEPTPAKVDSWMLLWQALVLYHSASAHCVSIWTRYADLPHSVLIVNLCVQLTHCLRLLSHSDQHDFPSFECSHRSVHCIMVILFLFY